MAIFRDFIVGTFVGITAFIAFVGAIFAFMKFVILISWLIDALLGSFA